MKVKRTVILCDGPQCEMMTLEHQAASDWFTIKKGSKLSKTEDKTEGDLHFCTRSCISHYYQ